MQAQPAASEVVLHSFRLVGRKGLTPSGNLAFDRQGNLYGTASNGGTPTPQYTGGAGVIYRLDNSGHQTVLYQFTGGAGGGAPTTGVTSDAAGNLYGTLSDGGNINACSGGGFTGCGLVYRLSAAGQYTVVYTFNGGTDGAIPGSDVITDAAANLYGTTTYGGNESACFGQFGAFEPPPGCGVVYQVDANAQQTVLYTFTGGADGGEPAAGVVEDASGNLYGTTVTGGDLIDCPAYEDTRAGCGVVFKLSSTGQYSVLYTFTGGADGAAPYAGVTLDSAGNLYGTTDAGGGSGYGVLYKIEANGQFGVLHSFAPEDAKGPSRLTVDAEGNIYGASRAGGTSNAGVVFEFTATGQFVSLYSFSVGIDGYEPSSPVLRDSHGNLYGTTGFGGKGGFGAVYRLDPAGQETVLTSFVPARGGANPVSGLIQDSQANLYGTTSTASASNGVVYKLDPKGIETVLHGFTGGTLGATDGYQPMGGVIRDAAGNLYGTTFYGGARGAGVVYRVNTSNQETILYTFTGSIDGANPMGSLVGDATGNLYGTTTQGGTSGGVVYKLDSNGQESVLYSFTGGADGRFPEAGLLKDDAGNLYGTTYGGGIDSANTGYGVVFELDASGHYSVLYSFMGGTDGANPESGVIQDAAGNLYGTTSAGGLGFGVVYKVDATGHETVLYAFTGGADGGYPSSGLLEDAAGDFYGTTQSGGLGYGVVFKLHSNGEESALYSFTGGADGSRPYAGVIANILGNLLGTTDDGGANGDGVVFQLTKP